ncbi:hypothetical protein BU23DRAFT_559481 [Bimuria novae-zelandiae CBS 107.79]|uniref:Uncharacterized protein n=1 Tax=Bimuria novae-zelandiae CBS 107.79 TaxID=1447943 RepID=A0A6A5UWL8_9PLEO|nr:hypothetical protein BU23DRAFT_559481 [Bimuria novae-zelandiae CBS 107.79]
MKYAWPEIKNLFSEIGHLVRQRDPDGIEIGFTSDAQFKSKSKSPQSRIVLDYRPVQEGNPKSLQSEASDGPRWFARDWTPAAPPFAPPGVVIGGMGNDSRHSSFRIIVCLVGADIATESLGQSRYTPRSETLGRRFSASRTGQYASSENDRKRRRIA